MALSLNEFNLLREYIHKQCGIHIPDDKTYLIESRFAQLLPANGCLDYGSFYEKLKANPTGPLRDQIIDAITTNETLWFRDAKPWVALKEQLLPELAQAIKAGTKRRIRIWSAACSSGQEPYSLAMMLDTMFGSNPAAVGGLSALSFEIVATDISPSVLFLAIAGNYNSIAMSRGLEESYKLRYFTQKGPIWSLKDDIRKRISFKRFNLQDSFASLGVFDLIFCRNVAIYFTDETKQVLFNKLAQALTPSGVLMLGASESLTGYTTPFKIKDYKGSLYYRKGDTP